MFKSLMEMIFEEAEDRKFTYSVIFKPASFKRYSKMEIVNIKTQMTEKEADFLNKAYGKLIASKSSPVKPGEDDLYIAIYQDELAKQEKNDYYVKKGDKKSDEKVNMTKGDFYAYRDKYGLDSIVPVDLNKKYSSYDETYVRFLNITESEYEKLKSETSSLKDYEIKKASPEEMLKFAKALPIKDGKRGLIMDLMSMVETIKRLKGKEKKDAYKKTAIEKEPKKVDTISKEASNFVYDNDRIIKSIISSYQVVKGKIDNIKARIDAEKKDKESDKPKTKKDQEKDDKKNSIFNKTGNEDVEKRALDNIEEKMPVLIDKIKSQKPELVSEIINKLKPIFQSSSTMGMFNRIISDLRDQIKENMKKKVKEMSTTGTGAFATPGEGEGMATKYAFGGAGADPKKKKKLKEEAQTKDDLGKATMIYDVIKNTVMNMSAKKALANLPKIKEFYNNLEKAAGDIATLADKYEKSDLDKSNQLSEISSNIIKLDNILSSLITIYEKAQSNPIK